MPISFPYNNKVSESNTAAFYPTGVDYTITTANTAEEFAIAKELFKEYQAFLGEDLCFQSFDTELQQLDTMYGPPSGVLLLAKHAGEYIGCVALRDKGNGACEMKRLYVKETHKGKGIGKKLAEIIIEKAKELGYQKMILDTLDRLALS